MAGHAGKDGLDKLAETLRSLQSEAESTFREAGGEIERLHRDLGGLLSRIQDQTFAARAQDALAHVESLQDLLSGGNEALAEAERQIADLERDLLQHRDAEKAAKQKIASLEHALTEREDNVNGASERVTELEARIAELEREQTERAEALQAARQRIAQLEQNLSKHYEEVNAAKAREDELRRECEEATRDLEAARARAGELESAVNARGDAEAAFESERAGLAAEIERLTNERDGLSTELAALNDSEAQARAEIETAQRGAAEARKALETARAEIATLTARIERADAEAKRISSLERDLESERARAAELEARLKEETSKGTRAALAKQLSEALSEHEAMQMELSKLRDEVLRLHGANVEQKPVKPPKQKSRKLDVSSAERDGRKRQLGDLLRESGIITADQLDTCLDVQRLTPQRHLGSILVEKGFATEDVIAEAIALQCKSTVVDLDDEKIAPDVVGAVSSRLAFLHTCIPLRVDGDTLVLAMENPLDLIAIEDVERATGLHVQPVVATPGDIRAAQDKYYAYFGE